MRIKRHESIPESFPRGDETGWVPGAVEKYVAAYDGSRFTVGLTGEQLHARYLECCDLLDDLIAYCERKQVELPELDDAALYRRVDKGLRNSPEIGITAAEQHWVMGVLTEVMRWKLDSQ